MKAKKHRKTKTALGQQASAVRQRNRSGGTSPKTRAELYEIARQRNLPGRSKMGRDELARALGYRPSGTSRSSPQTAPVRPGASVGKPAACQAS